MTLAKYSALALAILLPALLAPLVTLVFAATWVVLVVIGGHGSREHAIHLPAILSTLSVGWLTVFAWQVIIDYALGGA